VKTLAHISDLHVSAYGDTFHDRKKRVRRSRSQEQDPILQVEWAESGWRVVRTKRGLRLLDPEGYRHAVPSDKKSVGASDFVERAAVYACRTAARASSVLAANLPSAGATDLLLSTSPRNSNLRLLAAVAELDAECIFLTGDITDDGEGYELIEAAFRPWIDRGSLFVVPGNHDCYVFPLISTRRPKINQIEKNRDYKAFAQRVGMVHDASGAWSRLREDVMFVGLNSCARTQGFPYRHNGSIGKAQMAYLEALGSSKAWQDARLRVVGLHHHVAPLQPGIGRRASFEIGMRLDDASEVSRLLDALKVDLVLHGHRHISEERRPAGARFKVLAAPSLTLGCRSGDGPSYWHVELDSKLRVERRYVLAGRTAVLEDVEDEVPDEQDET
jgi:3',5'-cyclic-AMP phosphodiesterase